MLSINDIRKLTHERHLTSSLKDDFSTRTPGERQQPALQLSSGSVDFDYDPKLVSWAVQKNSGDHETKDTLDANVPDLSSPWFCDVHLRLASDDHHRHSLSDSQDEEQNLQQADILQFHTIYSLYIPLLPMKSLCRLASVSRGFAEIVRNENRCLRRHQFSYVYRREFIRFLNLSNATHKSIPQKLIIGPILNELYIKPQRLLVFYSPDIFQYNMRIAADKTDESHLSCLDTFLDNLWNVKDSDNRNVWHFRLFAVIRPDEPVTDHKDLSRHEINRMHLWHSEDLVLLFLPELPNVKMTHQLLNYGSSLGFPVSNAGGSFGLIYAIMRKYKPRFLVMRVKDIARIPDRILYNFPIIVFESRTFEGSYSEEWLCFSGDGVTAYQALLEQNESRESRDMKLNALFAQLGLTSVNSKQCWIFYFTEMWPGGTSKEIPQRDVLTIRSLFPGVPIFGGRAKQFTGNQFLPILSASENDPSRSLRTLPIPTVVTVLYFG